MREKHSTQKSDTLQHIDEKSSLLDDALLLIEQNFYFLHAGAFFDDLSKAHDLTSLHDPRIFRAYDEGAAYLFNPAIIEELMEDAYQSAPAQTTLFGYFVEFNAFRGICMAIVEALRLESPFRGYMHQKLGESYEDFVDLVSFVRNVLSHNIHAEIRLDEKDFKGTRERIIRMRRDPDIRFSLCYSTDLPEIGTPSETYSFDCHVDFASLREGMAFLEIVPPLTLMKLSELCYNFVIGYRLTRV